MIQRNIGDQGSGRFNGVGCIEPAAQPHFQHPDIELRICKYHSGCQRPELEIREFQIATYRFDFLERSNNGRVTGGFTVDYYAFVVAVHMRGRVGTNALSGSAQQRVTHGNT